LSARNRYLDPGVRRDDDVCVVACAGMTGLVIPEGGNVTQAVIPVKTGIQ